jgi:hypothetical protein
MPSRIDNAKQWRDRTDETLVLADQMKHAESKTILTVIAHAYAELARLAERREANKTDGVTRQGPVHR